MAKYLKSDRRTDKQFEIKYEQYINEPNIRASQDNLGVRLNTPPWSSNTGVPLVYTLNTNETKLTTRILVYILLLVMHMTDRHQHCT